MNTQEIDKIVTDRLRSHNLIPVGKIHQSAPFYYRFFTTSNRVGNWGTIEISIKREEDIEAKIIDCVTRYQRMIAR
jgi:hypothetical protein